MKEKKGRRGLGVGGGDFKVVILQVERVLGRSVQNLQETGRTPSARIRRVK